VKIINLGQRTPAWLAWRAGGVGSSDAAAVLGVSPWKSRAALLREKVRLLTGHEVKDRSNGAMRRGRDLEPRVAAWYAGWYARPTAAVCGEHDTHGWLRASFDGLAADGVAVEIKCPNAADHEMALAGKVPEKYVPQCDHLLLAGENTVRELHYVSYSDFFDRHRQYAVVVVRPAAGRLALLLDAERAFWDEVQAQIAAE
jgi:putative phage-type endonuclease